MSPEAPASQDTPPWWEQVPKGRVIPLAFVKIDLKGGTAEWAELAPEKVKKRRDGYRAGVESLARATQAAQPLNWQGDGVMLFLTDGDGEPAPLRAVRAARLLWQRVRVDLSIPARIAVHAAHVAWDPETGKLDHPALDHCGHLEGVTPENAMVVSGDVYLALPEGEKQDFAPLGISRRDGIPVFVFPAGAAARKQKDAFREDGDLALWEAFRRYAEGPEIRFLRYVGLRLTKREPPALRIEDVFVPLEVQVRTRTPLRSREEPRVASDRKQTRAETEETREVRLPPFTGTEAEEWVTAPPQPFREVFKPRRALVVLGDPGSGKTTLLRWLAVVAGGGRLAMARELGTEMWLLPLPVSVGVLAAVRSELGPGASVPDALARYFHARNVGDEAELRAFLLRRLEAGECLVLLDGLDEVRSAEEREEVRAWLESFAARYPRNRFVVTSRHVGYPGFVVADGPDVTLRPFDDEQVRRYVTAFTRAYRRWETGVPEDAEAEREAEQLLGALGGSPRLTALARNPFMLSALALINRAEGRLPRHRVQFYAIFARALCETWDSARRLVMSAPDPQRVLRFEEEAIPILGELAREMHERYPAGVAPADSVISTLATALVKRRGVPEDVARRSAVEFLDRAGHETQILLERGAGRWGFLHLTFQEFFVAAGLHASEEFEGEAIAHLYDPRWEEILRLGVGYLALVQSRPEGARRFIEKVLARRKRGPLAEIYALLRKHMPLAALLTAEAGEALPHEFQRRVAAEFARWVLEMPHNIAERFLGEIALTDFREVVAEPLLEALRDREVMVRGQAARALGALGAREAVPALLEALRDREVMVRAGAAQALGALRATEVVPALLEALRDPVEWVRGQAAEALGAVRAEGAVPALLEALRDREVMVRAGAAQALGALRATEVVPALLEALRDREVMVRGQAARALGALGAREAVPALLEALRDPVEWVRGQAAEALGAVRAEGAVPALLEALRDPDAGVRRVAAQALGAVRAEGAVPALLEALRDPEGWVRGQAARALGALGVRQVVPALLEALRDTDAGVRRQAARALGAVRAEGAVPALLEALRDREVGVRLGAAQALGALRAEGAAPALLEALRDREVGVRARAVEALGALGARAVPALVAYAKGRTVGDWERHNAIDALWRIAAAPSGPKPVNGRQSKSQKPRRAAEARPRRTGGRPR